MWPPDLRGSVYTYVDVPDLRTLRCRRQESFLIRVARSLRTSSVVCCRLPQQPNARVGSSRRVTAFVRVYDTTRQESPVGVTARVVDGHGAAAFSQTTNVRPAGIAPSSADYLLDLLFRRLLRAIACSPSKPCARNTASPVTCASACANRIQIVTARAGNAAPSQRIAAGSCPSHCVVDPGTRPLPCSAAIAAGCRSPGLS